MLYARLSEAIKALHNPGVQNHLTGRLASSALHDLFIFSTTWAKPSPLHSGGPFQVVCALLHLCALPSISPVGTRSLDAILASGYLVQASFIKAQARSGGFEQQGAGPGSPPGRENCGKIVFWEAGLPTVLYWAFTNFLRCSFGIPVRYAFGDPKVRLEECTMEKELW